MSIESRKVHLSLIELFRVDILEIFAEIHRLEALEEMLAVDLAEVVVSIRFAEVPLESLHVVGRDQPLSQSHDLGFSALS